MSIMHNKFAALSSVLNEVSRLSQEPYDENRWNSFCRKLQLKLPIDLLPLMEDHINKIQLLKQKVSYLSFRSSTLELLHQINMEISSLAPLDKILSLSADRLRNISKASIVFIALMDKDLNKIRIQVLLGAQTNELLNYEQEVKKGIVGLVEKEKTPYVISDYKKEKDLIDPLASKLIEKEGIRSIIAAPLLVNKELIGLVFLARRQPYTSTELNIEMLENYCYQTAIAIENARLYANELRITNLHQEIFAEALYSGYSGIIQKLSDFINEPIIFMDEYGNSIYDIFPSRLAGNTSELFFNYYLLYEKIQSKYRLLQKTTELRFDDNFVCTVFPVILHERTVAYLIIPRTFDKHDNIDIMAIEQSRNILALKISQERTKTEVELRLRQDYLYDLILGLEPEEDLMRRGRYLKVDFKNPRHIIIFSPDAIDSSEEDNKILMQSLEKIRYKLDTATLPLSMIHGQKLIVITSNHQTKRVAKSILTYFREYYPVSSVAIGISTSVKDPHDYVRGYEEAKKAVEFANLFGGDNEIIHYDDLGIIGVLFEANNLKSIKSFSKKYIGALAEYDAINKKDLIRSLEVFLENESVIQSSADQLHVHYNTLRYRLNKIKEITGLKLTNPQNRLNIQIALLIHKFIAEISHSVEQPNRYDN